MKTNQTTIRQTGCVLTVAAMALLTLAVDARAAPPTAKTPPLPPTERRLEQDVTLRDVVTVPGKVMGRKVTIEGIVSHVYSNRMFTLRGSGDLQNSHVPILASAPIPGQPGRSDARPMRVGDKVQVTGVVTRFAVEQMQKTTGQKWVERDYRVFLSKPALLASMAVVEPGSSSNVQEAPMPPDQAQPVRLYIIGVRSPDKNLKSFALFSDFLAVSDRKALTGKVLKFGAVKVLSVISDRGFYVGDTAGNRLFCVLDHALDDGKMENIIVVKKGQTLALEGTIEKMPTEQGALKRWTVDTKEAAQLAKQSVYLHVSFIQFK